MPTVFFFCNDTATTEIYTDGHTRSLHDALPILAGERTTQPWHAAAAGVAVRAWIARGFDKLLDDMGWCRTVGIAHAEVDDVLAGRTGARLHRVHFREDVGRQAFDAIEFFAHLHSARTKPGKIGRESCRERGGQYV